MEQERHGSLEGLVAGRLGAARDTRCRLSGASLRLLPPIPPTAVTRAELADSQPDRTYGWLAVSAEGDHVVPLGRGAAASVVEVTAETLDMVGVVESDRIAVALNSDGAAVGTRWAEAAAGIASAAVAIGPARGGRILEVVDSVHATVLISTPTVAEELARVAGRTTSVHTVVLTGEVLDPGRRAAIGRHLGVAVGEVVLDPVFGAAVASRPPGATAFAVTRPGLVGSHRLDGGAIEWTLRCDWSPLLAGRDLRMGIAGPERRGPIDGTTRLPPPRWTIGDHVLVRGRWVSLSYLRRRLGPRGWCLAIRRGERADHSTLRVASAASLARVRRFVAEHLPVAHRVTVDPDLDGRPALVVDPQHLIGG